MKARAAQCRRARFCGKIYISTDYTQSLPKKYNISSQKYTISSKNEYTFLTAREKYDTIWCIEIRIYNVKEIAAAEHAASPHYII